VTGNRKHCYYKIIEIYHKTAVTDGHFSGAYLGGRGVLPPQAAESKGQQNKYFERKE
jgi:hypothetical protein